MYGKLFIKEISARWFFNTNESLCQIYIVKSSGLET